MSVCPVCGFDDPSARNFCCQCGARFDELEVAKKPGGTKGGFGEETIQAPEDERKAGKSKEKPVSSDKDAKTSASSDKDAKTSASKPFSAFPSSGPPRLGGAATPDEGEKEEKTIAAAEKPEKVAVEKPEKAAAKKSEKEEASGIKVKRGSEVEEEEGLGESTFVAAPLSDKNKRSGGTPMPRDPGVAKGPAGWAILPPPPMRSGPTPGKAEAAPEVAKVDAKPTPKPAPMPFSPGLSAPSPVSPPEAVPQAPFGEETIVAGTPPTPPVVQASLPGKGPAAAAPNMAPAKSEMKATPAQGSTVVSAKPVLPPKTADAEGGLQPLLAEQPSSSPHLVSAVAEATSISAPPPILNPLTQGSDATTISAPPLAGASSSSGPLFGFADPKSLIGQRFDQFHITKSFEGGELGILFRAMHVYLKQPFLLEVLSPPEAQKELFFERYREEARQVSQLKEEHIVSLANFGVIPKVGLYLATEFLDGRTLQQLLQRQEVFSIEDLKELMQGLCAALDHAHKKGVLHRDVRPGNIVLGEQGAASVKLSHFGFSALTREMGLLDDEMLALRMAKYTAPEQVKGGEVDGRIDLYALGVVLYRLLTGRSPFGGNNAQDVLRAQMNVVPAPLHRVASWGSWAPLLEDFLQSALAKEPSNRPPHAEAFWAACEEALEAQSRWESGGLSSDLLTVIDAFEKDTEEDAGASETEGSKPISMLAESGSGEPVPMRDFGLDDDDDAFGVVGQPTKKWLVPGAVALLFLILGGWWVFSGPSSGPIVAKKPLTPPRQRPPTRPSYVPRRDLPRLGVRSARPPFERPKHLRQPRVPAQKLRVAAPSRRVDVPRRAPTPPVATREPVVRKVELPRRRPPRASPAKRRYLASMRQLYRWRRRYGLHLRDMGRSSYSGYRRARRAARRGNYAAANRQLARLSRRFGRFRKLSRSVLQEKFKRLQAAHRRAKRRRRVSAATLSRVENQLFARIFMSFSANQPRQMNSLMNRAFRSLRYNPRTASP